MRPNYSAGEVEALILNYVARRAKVNTTPAGLNVLVRMADLSRALKSLPSKYSDVIFWVGLVGLPEQDAAARLRISQQAVGKRYRQGLEELTYIMNGGL